MSGTKVITNISNNKQTHLKNPSKSSQISHFTLNLCSLRSQMWYVLTCIYVLLWTRSGWKALIHFHQNLWEMTWNRFKQDFEHRWVNKHLTAGFVVHLSLICDTVLTSDVDWQEFQNHNKFDFISFNLSYSHHLFYFLYRSIKKKNNTTNLNDVPAFGHKMPFSSVGSAALLRMLRRRNGFESFYFNAGSRFRWPAFPLFLLLIALNHFISFKQKTFKSIAIRH
jgi:hypothetical protein